MRNDDEETGVKRKVHVRPSQTSLRTALDEYLAARPEINRLFTRRDILLQVYDLLKTPLHNMDFQTSGIDTCLIFSLIPQNTFYYY